MGIILGAERREARDIVPIASPSRVLVMLEQFAGVAYIAVVVSRLIGLTINRLQDK